MEVNRSIVITFTPQEVELMKKTRALFDRLTDRLADMGLSVDATPELEAIWNVYETLNDNLDNWVSGQIIC